MQPLKAVGTAPVRDVGQPSSGFIDAARAGVTSYTDADMARLGAIVAHSEDAILSKDLTGTITSWNPAAERMYGWTEAEMIGRHVTTIVPPDHIGDFEDIMRRIRAGEVVDHFESVRLHRSGRRIDVSISVSPIKNAQGIVMGASSIARDITEERNLCEQIARLYKEVQDELEERKKAEDELRRSEERYRSLVTATSQVVWSTRADGTVIDDIPSWRAYTGQSKEEVQGTKWAEAIHPEDQEPTTQAWLQAVQNRSLFTHEYRLRSKSGEYHYMHSRAVPIMDEQGNVREWIGTTTDIEEAKLAEDKVRKMHEELEHRVAMRTSELYIANRKLRAEIIERQRIEEQDRANLKRLSHIIDSMPMGAIITDEQLKVLHLNERFCQLFKLESPSSLIHKNGQEIMELAREHLSQPEHYGDNLFEILQKQQPVFGLELQMRDGRIISCDYIPIFVQEMHRGHILLYRDITQERRTDAAKSEFMSLASHQLRTPLTAIRWSLGKLSKSMKHKATDLEYNILVEGHHEAVRMAETIDTMLAISQVESGKMRLRKTTVALKLCLLEIIDSFKEESSGRNQTVTLECPDDLHMPSDPKLLHEIFGNLISNAVKYTPADGSIFITAHQLESAVRIDVTDTGYGIPAHQHDQIFNKYFRGENVLHKETDGNGLGLYLVSQLVKLLDGTISFVSREGQGTTFSIHFPLLTL